jgi:PAS domain S-box-containing protein
MIRSLAGTPVEGRPGWRRVRAVAWLVVSVLALAVRAPAADAIKVRIGVEMNSFPLSFENPQKKADGFAAELLREVGRVGGIEFELVSNSWLFISTEFTAGRLDALANVTITDERRETMDFSIGHAYIHGVSYTRHGTQLYTQTSQFAGKTMATLKGSVGQSNAVKNGGWGARVVPFFPARAMFEAVKKGDCDFALVMRPLQFEEPDELGLHREFVDDVVHQFYIAVHRGDRLLLERINEALATVRHNGTFDRIYAKWIGPIEPHPIRFADLRPYFLPVTVVLLLAGVVFWWQRRVNRRLTRQASALLESEEKYRLLVENAHEGIFVLQDGVFRFANTTAQRLTGLSETAILGRPMLDFTRPEDRDEVCRVHQQLLTGGILENRRIYQLAVPQGRELWISLTGVRIDWQGRPATLNFATDITEARRSELARQEAAERLHKIATRVPGFVYQYRLRPDGTSCFPYASDGIEEIYRVKADDVGENATKVFAAHHPEDGAALVASIQESARTLTPWQHEYRVKFADGTVRWLAGNSLPQREADGSVLWHGFISDITERKKADDRIRESLREKEALLREVHHRVKNNLQVVTSLLRLEAGRSTQTDTKAVLKEMQGRIHAMALLHEKLYRSGTFAAVDLGVYLKQLATQAFRALLTDPGAVRLSLDLAAVQVEMDQAMPCGLLVNELISNCLKHGFPAGRTGEVRIELKPVDGGSQLCLRVSDTGVGLPADFDSKRGHSLGLQLVSDLTRQIDGTLAVGPGPGAVFTVTFTPERLSSQHPFPQSILPQDTKT